jgi:tellurite resistance protein TehA-like permease
MTAEPATDTSEPSTGTPMVALRRTDVVPSASWTIVMTLGVVSLDMLAVHQTVLSAILLWFAVAVWLLLVVVLGAPMLYRRGRFRRDAGLPVTLTSVAASAVLGARFAMQDHRVIGAVLLGVAAIGWAVLLVPVLRHWKTPTVGVSFVLAVSTQGLALVGALLAVAYHARWLLTGAALLVVLGLVFYIFTLARFDLRQLIDGQGDHWIAGGALAISALSLGLVTEAASALGRLGYLHQLLRVGTLVLWCVAMAWLVPLIVSEIARPRLAYDVRRWATVFPLGMYAACSFTVGRVAGIPGIVRFGQVETWVALGATVLALAGLTRSGWRAWRPPEAAKQASSAPHA